LSIAIRKDFTTEDTEDTEKKWREIQKSEESF